MRFVANGPSIPDDLLLARDEGRVVFFCGAGVSQARAGLPDFFGLADKVVKELGVPQEADVQKVLSEAKEIARRTGVDGLISADRVFGLLERNFSVQDIETEVARALKPAGIADLAAHKLLLDLATTPEGSVRLVTTNFDRLFSDCCKYLPIWQPPRLPDPSRNKDMHGIIHLHGITNTDYSGSEEDGFILSSSDFGRAYLAEGWATSLFKEIIEHYVVVFVGYTADDPPIHYLLEALNSKSGMLEDVYAFQAGRKDEAMAKWRHKGVEAITYSEEDNHSVLWETLEFWAERAKDSRAWQDGVIELARKGPEKLLSYERGQVAHIISTTDGARTFAAGDNPPPADWLCVFDPSRRFETPGDQIGFLEKGDFIDPFQLYGLDSDIPPKPVKPEDEDYLTSREIPSGAWSALSLNRRDRQNLRDEHLTAIAGPWSANSPNLPSRLWTIGAWISEVADQPAAVWWAAKQNGLHPDIQRKIKLTLSRSDKNVSPAVQKAWRYLFESWRKPKRHFDDAFYDLLSFTKKHGWDSAAIRQYTTLCRPFITAEPNWFRKQTPPQPVDNCKIDDLIRLDVKYPKHYEDTDIPDNWLAVVLVEHRKNLEYAVHLETEIGGFGLSISEPIVADKRPDQKRSGSYPIDGLYGAVLHCCDLMERLIDLDRAAAKRELSAWPADDDTVFARLLIWAIGNRKLIPARQLGPALGRLSDKAFWDSHHQRDFLLVLAKRWSDLHEQVKKKLEKRLFKGSPKLKGETTAQHLKWRAIEILERLHWLASNGSSFSFDLEEKTKALRDIVPEWKLEEAEAAARSMSSGVMVDWVKTVTGFDELLNEPLATTLSKAAELSGRREEHFTRYDPFGGLSAEYPVRAFLALVNAAKRSEYPPWAWRTFLNADARKNDKPKLTAVIGERLSGFPDEAIADFIRPASEWLLNVSKQLAEHCPETFDKSVKKLIQVLLQEPDDSSSGIVRGNREPEWASEAINAPVGKLAEALMNDPRKDGLKAGKGFPSDWLILVEVLLGLPNDLCHHAQVIFAFNLNWFYHIDPDWTQTNMLSVLDGDKKEDRDAIWSGFLWRARMPNPELYSRLKPRLLELAKQQKTGMRKYDEALSGIILAGWLNTDEDTGDRPVSTSEMKDVLLNSDDDFRSHMLWTLEQWSKAEDGKDGYSALLPEFLNEVWPRQKAAKSPLISSRLVDLAFANTEQFPEISRAVLPLLTTIDNEHIHLTSLRRKENNIIDLHPEKTMAILYKILPDNVDLWPYEINTTLERITTADNSLRQDERLIELKRRWNAR